ncbi:hypothetical protein [Paeniglutamicibacter antarcticus]|uniref:N-acetyltransferase domain-containing protein n=1 Tax=Paeniglutamicibacter antarcticus TaxID=494023 RepID=A0ABP9TTT4_9MICC
MTRVIENNQEQHRYQLFVQGDLAGFVQYSMRKNELWVHYVQLKRRYKSEETIEFLLLHIVDEVRRKRLALMPFCPAMRLFVVERPEFTALVPPLWHVRFLTGSTSSLRPMDRVRYTGPAKRRTTAEKRAQAREADALKQTLAVHETVYSPEISIA